ncbi:hypothetical protein ABTE92_19490, partial [Acinetobacter baumannii]
VSAPGGLPPWLTFDPTTAIFAFQVPAAADKAVDARSTWPNTIYPPSLRAARIPVTVSASGAGQTYTVTVDMSFYSPRSPAV